MLKQSLRQLRSLFIMFLVCVVGFQSNVDAASQADLNAIKHGWTFYEELVQNNCSPESGLATDTLPGGVPEPYRSLISSAAQEYNADPNLVAAAFYWENRGFPDPKKTDWASSSEGASGPMQFMPKTWAAYGVDGDGDGEKNVNDIEDAIYAGANYLAAVGGKAGTPLGTLKKPLAENTLLRAAASYNTGPGNVDALGVNATLESINEETREYLQATFILISSGFTKSAQDGGTLSVSTDSEATTAVDTSVGAECTNAAAATMPGSGKGDFIDNTSVAIPGAAEAIALAQQIATYPPNKLQQICDGSPNCLQRCERLAGVVWGRSSSGYATANEHWNNAPDKHPGDRNVPPGALLYYETGSVYGHVATYLGNNLILSNDVGDAASGIRGGAYIVSASDMEGGLWNLDYLGWVNPVPWGR